MREPGQGLSERSHKAPDKKSVLKIAPSVLSADFSQLGAEVIRAEEGGADALHFDIMDGHFVPNITFGSEVVRALRDKSRLPFQVHLMIEKPDRYIEPFVKAGGDTICVHIEACTRIHRIIRQIERQGAQAGVALNPSTPVNSIESVLDRIDLLTVMSVMPGFGGQDFIPTVLPKICKARRMIDGRRLAVDIAVDGGINEDTGYLAAKAGANVLVAGTAVFRKGNISRAIKMLRKSAAAAWKLNQASDMAFSL
jgi:ribulose-phosphate 3-epimerase